METYTLGLATDSFSDYGFFDLIEKVSRNYGFTTYRVHKSNLTETVDRLLSRELRFAAYYDRASDTSAQFLRVYEAFSAVDDIVFFVDLEKQEFAADKAVMHEAFKQIGIRVPETIIIPELSNQPQIMITESDLDILGRPFVIKPSFNTGSGNGVYLNGFSLADVEDKRYYFPDDKYLLQTKIVPKMENQMRFWFRIFYVCGKILITWWDNYTHRYAVFSEKHADFVDTERIRKTMAAIQKLCGLEFFSTELAISENDEMYAIDYVNEICDMRLQSGHVDGVPDEVVKIIATEIVNHISGLIQKF